MSKREAIRNTQSQVGSRECEKKHPTSSFRSDTVFFLTMLLSFRVMTPDDRRFR